MARPICFLVMPFGRKATPARPGAVGPAEVDFDALWQRVLRPLLADVGYDVVRADADSSGLILPEMLERLTLADLVVAELTQVNANVYYEVGVRQASRRRGCLLVAADWAPVAFDLSQVRRVEYPLPDGGVPEEIVPAARARLEVGLRSLRDGESPVFQAVPDQQETRPVNPERYATLLKQVEGVTAWEEKIGEVRLSRDAARARKLRDKLSKEKAVIESVWLSVLLLLRDVAGFDDVIAFVDDPGFPVALRELPLVREQRLLAVAKAGDDLAAAAALRMLIERLGPSSERHGLLGGRFKKLARAAAQAGDHAGARRYTDLAIDAYRDGMVADLNDFYPSSNLPRLLRARGAPGDKEEAARIAGLVVLQVERALALGRANEWARPTLLGCAFDAGDAAKAEQLGAEVEREGPDAWKLETTLDDLRAAVGLAPAGRRKRLARVVERLERLLAPKASAPS